MARALEETPRSAVPPLGINTSMFGAGYRGTSWGRGDPSAAPLRDKKSHVAKPDSFKEWKDFYKFNRSTHLYTTANPGEFPNDRSKVMFYLSYMKEGLPGQFAENVVQGMMDWEVLRLDPAPNFKVFIEKLTRMFRDVNKKAMAQEQLSRSFQGKMTAELFQLFEQRVRAARYESGHNKYLIRVMKKALNVEVVDMIYTMQDLPSLGRSFEMWPFALTSNSRSTAKTSKEIGGIDRFLLPEITRDLRSIQGSTNWWR
jgi:hypothetical protein